VTDEVEHLGADDLLLLAAGLLGDPPPLRDRRLLEAAAERTSASAFGQDAYPDIWTKAAALLHAVVKNHPLVDGNKRLGWLACAVFLDLNGIDPTPAGNDEVFDLVMAVASGPIEVEELARRLRNVVGDRTG